MQSNVNEQQIKQLRQADLKSFMNRPITKHELEGLPANHMIVPNFLNRKQRRLLNKKNK